MTDEDVERSARLLRDGLCSAGHAIRSARDLDATGRCGRCTAAVEAERADLRAAADLRTEQGRD